MIKEYSNTTFRLAELLAKEEAAHTTHLNFRFNLHVVSTNQIIADYIRSTCHLTHVSFLGTIGFKHLYPLADALKANTTLRSICFLFFQMRDCDPLYEAISFSSSVEVLDFRSTCLPSIPLMERFFISNTSVCETPKCNCGSSTCNLTKFRSIASRNQSLYYKLLKFIYMKLDDVKWID